MGLFGRNYALALMLCSLPSSLFVILFTVEFHLIKCKYFESDLEEIVYSYAFRFAASVLATFTTLMFIYLSMLNFENFTTKPCSLLRLYYFIGQ